MDMRPRSDGLERTTVYELLADRVRQQLLGVVAIVDRTTVSAAADRIATGVDDVGERTRTADAEVVAVELVHNHLPRLDRHDVVDYDRREGTIEPGPHFSDVEPLVPTPESSLESSR